MKNLLFASILMLGAMPGTTLLAGADGAAEAPVTSADGVVHLPTYRVVYLPPFLVTDTSKIDWVYVKIPHFEVLSCAANTDDFAKQVCWEQGVLDMTVPADLQARSIVPTSLILLSQDMKKKISRTIASLAQRNSLRASEALDKAAGVSSLYLPDSIPQVRLWDADSTGVDVILDNRSPAPHADSRNLAPGLALDGIPVEMGDLGANTTGSMGSFGSGTVRSRPAGVFKNLVFKPEYLFSVLSRRAPGLPAWFIAGMLNFRFHDSGDNFYVASQSFSESDQVMSLPTFWLTPEITKFLRTHPDLFVSARSDPPSLLTMREFILAPAPSAATNNETDKESWLNDTWKKSARPYPIPKPEDVAAVILLHGAEPGSPWRYPIWQAQAGLFVRWAFDDKTFARRQALWKFAARASTEPATEAMFKDCFGLGFAGMDAQLSAYLAKAVKEPLDLFSSTAIEIPPRHPREANEAETARILGDWERKEIEFVKTSHAEYVDLYSRQAEQTLLGAYRRGERDPGLLAAIGLYECAVGNDVQARDFLAAAVQAGVIRPRAYAELARIRLSAALSAPGAGGKLDAGQVASVLDLLKPLRSQPPPQFATYMLTALTWAHASMSPGPADLAMLEEGIYYFPDDPRLILAVARVEAQAGRKNVLIALFDRGLQKVTDPAARKLLGTLRAQLGPPTAEPVAAAVPAGGAEVAESPRPPTVPAASSPIGNLRVGVIIDMTREGRKIARPTPEHPAYYFPIYIGYKEMGAVLTEWHRAPPPLDEAKRTMSGALLEQGYRVATRLHPPSLAIVFRWGAVAAEVLAQPGGNGPMWHGENGAESVSTVSNLIAAPRRAVNQDEVMTMIAGDRWGDLDPNDPGQEEFVNLQPRYYLMISALDFPAFTRHKQVLLWRAHVSTNYWGHYMDQVLEPLITAAAPFLGRETGRPQIVTTPVGAVGHVIVGTPEVKDYPDQTPPSAP